MFLDFWAFSAVSSVFFSKPYQNQGFFWNEVISCFLLAFEAGGVVSPRTFGFFGFLGIPAVLGPFFFGMKFLFFDFLDFLQFRAFFQSPTKKARVLIGFGHSSFCLFGPFEGGGVVSPRTFGFFGFFGISAVLSIFLFGLFFVFWIFWNFCSFEPYFFQSPNKTKVLIGFCHSSVYLDPFGGGWFLPGLLDFLDFLEFPQF